MQLAEAYRILELSPGATEEEVRRAWLDLTKVWHPDRFGNDADLRRKAEQKLKEINEAYETILGGPRLGGGKARKAAISADLIFGVIWFVLAVFVLLRRPNPSGIGVAAILFFAAAYYLLRFRRR
jgi:hypothetical protein